MKGVTRFMRVGGLVTVLIFIAGGIAMAEERDPLKPRVPAAKRAEARDMKSPFYKDSREAPADIVAEGKKLYEGKGTCFNCHGKSGQGDGPAGKILNPSPRNFTNCKFHKRRKDGELMWIIKNGSAGTGMVPLVPKAITEEEAWKIIAYERSFCDKWMK